MSTQKNPAEFKNGDVITGYGSTYEVIENDKRGMSSLKNLRTGAIENYNAYNNCAFELETVLADAPAATPPPTEQMSTKVCPQCNKPLQRVTQSSTSPLNEHQFDAEKAGDWFCDKCPCNGRGLANYAYFWDRELTPATSPPTGESQPCRSHEHPQGCGCQDGPSEQEMEASKGDWPEDFRDENGNYENRCIRCQQGFIGNKRRVVCKLCAAKFPVKGEDVGVERALAVLANIADKYDANELDDEARKKWGEFDEYDSVYSPLQIILYTGRGGATLLTLADCIAARDALASLRAGTGENKSGLTLESLRAANKTRSVRWSGGTSCGIEFAAVELAGEVGEACNAVKKLSRLGRGMKGGSDTIVNLTEELADTVICADLLAMEVGIDLGAAVAAKFNATSEKHGFPERLAIRDAEGAGG